MDKADTTSQIAIKSSIVYLKGIIIRYAILLLFSAWLTFGLSASPVMYFGMTFMLLVCLLVDVVPFVILHRQYLDLNRDMRVSVDKSQGLITIWNQGQHRTVNLGHIRPVKVVESWAGDGAWSSHKYAVIQTDSPENIIITSYLVKKLPDFFKDVGVETVRVRRIFPFVFRGDKQRVPSSAA